MSDFESELLELVEADSESKKKRKSKSKTKASSSKRRKTQQVSDSDEEPESEEEEDPYPIEGKYADDADMDRLMQMPEIEREEILSQRLEELQKIQDKKAISRMARMGTRGEADSVSKAAKRQHTARGATKEKMKKLDELKARRKAKGDKQRNDSPRRDRSSSPMDVETSEDEDEDGQISKSEQEEERERRLYGNPVVDEGPITMEDLDKCRLSRDQLAKNCMAPWFEDYVKGAWVRYLIGSEDNQPIYRICEVANLGAEVVKPYKINDKTVNQALELRHGNSVRVFLMDKVSNASFEIKEFDRLVRTCGTESVKLPTKQSLEKKLNQITKLVTQPMTEADISAMLSRKSQMSTFKTPASLTLEKSRLNQARTLAQRRHDFTEVAEIDLKLAELAQSIGEDASPNGNGRKANDDMLAKVSERNRKANAESVRRAELMETERKRKERKLALAGNSGTATPSDPSARLRTVPRTFNASTSSPRSGTPNPDGTPLLKPQTDDQLLRIASPLANSQTKTFESNVVDSIEVDLGDF